MSEQLKSKATVSRYLHGGRHATLDADLLEWIMRRQLRVAAPAPGAAQHLFPRQRRPVMFL